MYSKQKEEFFKLVKSTEEPMYQGYDFIDYTLLCVHCPSFSQLTEEEAMDFIKSLGFAVVNFTINQEKLDQLEKLAAQEETQRKMVRELRKMIADKEKEVANLKQLIKDKDKQNYLVQQELLSFQISEGGIKRGYKVQLDEYGTPPLTCVGCEHKYIVYLFRKS